MPIHREHSRQGFNREENDEEQEVLEMLDVRTETSRLSCQVHVTDEMDGMELTLAPQ